MKGAEASYGEGGDEVAVERRCARRAAVRTISFQRSRLLRGFRDRPKLPGRIPVLDGGRLHMETLFHALLWSL